jgi:hypothetical protein
VSASAASAIGHQPPVGSLFAAFLGYNPIATLVNGLPASATHGADLSTLTSKEFFPQLISGPFHHGLVIVFIAAIVMSLIGAVASLFRGGRYIHTEPDPATPAEPAPVLRPEWTPRPLRDQQPISVPNRGLSGC